jgi:trans-aconitate methyltransferase
MLIKKISQDQMRKFAVELLLPIKGKILELGCSNGNFVSILKNRNIDLSNYIGIDISKEKILEAKKLYPDINFINKDICNNMNYLKDIDNFISFQTLEHIGSINGFEDCLILKNLKSNTKIIISIPNSPYKNEHKRWFEIEGWINRYKKFINFSDKIIIQNIKKKNKRSFLFKGYRK